MNEIKSEYSRKSELVLEGTPFEVVKHNLTANIDVELSRNCNYSGSGRCSGWCPKAFIKDPAEDAFMSDENFYKLIGNLVAIDYQGSISFVGYNEPLYMDISKLEERIAYTHERLPKSKININTNGSLLTKEKLDRLHKAGLNGLNLQIYPVSEEERTKFPYSFAEKAKVRYEKRLGFTAEPIERLEGFYYAWNISSYEPLDDRGIQFWVYAKNLLGYGCSRGGTVKAGGKYIKTDTCKQIGRFLAVKWNGNMYMCTNMIDFCPSHQKFCLGNLKTHNIWDAYQNAIPYIKKLTKPASANNEYPVECRGCSFVPNVEQIIRFKEQMQRL